MEPTIPPPLNQPPVSSQPVQSGAVPASMASPAPGAIQPPPISSAASQATGPMPPVKGKGWMIALAVIGLVILLLGAAVLAVPLLLSGKKTTGNGAGTNKPPQGSSLTASRLASLDKTDLFWRYFKNAAMQQKVLATHRIVTVLDPAKPDDMSVDSIRHGFDYKAKKGDMAEDSAISGDTVSKKTRCINGAEFYQSISNGKVDAWRSPDSPTDFCTPQRRAEFMTDGLNTGGLSNSQADAFVGLLRKQVGLVTVSKAVLEDHKGKQYVHFTADLSPIKTEGEFAGSDLYQGVQWLTYAFEATGLSVDTYPYGYKMMYGNGFHIEYYVDPIAQLPRYVKINDTPFRKDDGALAKPLDEISMATVLTFGISTFDAGTSNEQPIRLDW